VSANQYTTMHVFDGAAEFRRRQALEERVKPLAEALWRTGELDPSRYPDAVAALAQARQLYRADEVVTAFGPVPT
jgi:hypothetical protein